MLSSAVRRFHTNSRLGFQSNNLLRQVSLTFFTKETCQLCKNAKEVLSTTLADDEFQGIDLKVVDIMKPENEDAYDRYCFDVPVLHVDRSGQKPVKFMHYFDKEELAQEFRRQT